VSLGRTPSQTVGPFFEFALPWREGPYVVDKDRPDVICLSGRFLDGRGDPIGDGLVETWQADPQGRLHDAKGAPSSFRGFGRCATDRDGWYRIFTLQPGAVLDSSGVRHAPQIVMVVFARGLLKHAVTRVYFSDREAENATDPVLSLVRDPAARASLLASPVQGGYRFDIRLQGEGATLFFDV
jgi:protocatechuate 3,4-dioxygenase alpha subunit